MYMYTYMYITKYALYLAYNIIQMHVKVPGGHAFTNVFIEVSKYYYNPRPLLNQQLLLLPPPPTKILNETLSVTSSTLKMWLCHVCCCGVDGWASYTGCSQAL